MDLLHDCFLLATTGRNFVNKSLNPLDEIRLMISRMVFNWNFIISPAPALSDSHNFFEYFPMDFWANHVQ
jgi:hypothetical protein